MQLKIEKVYTVRETRHGADYGSDHQFLIGKYRVKLKKVGKTTRSFRFELNQIPYDCTVEVMNRFRGLDVVHKMLEELWIEVHNIVQEVVTKLPKGKEMQNGKVVV